MREVLSNLVELVGAQQRRRWIVVMLIGICASAIEALAAVMIYVLLTVANGDLTVPLLGDLHDRFPGTSESRIITWIAVLMVVFFFVRAAVLFAQAYLQNRVAHEAGALISQRLVMGYLRMPYSFHLLRNSAESLRTAYQSVLDLTSYALVPVVTLISEALVVLAMFVVLFITAPIATLLVIGVLAPVVYLLLRAVQPRIAQSGAVVFETHELNMRSIQQGLGGVREIKVLGREGFFGEKYSASRLLLARALYRRAALTEVPRITIETLLMLLIVGFVGITALTGGSLETSVSTLGLFGYAALRVMPGMNRVISQLNSLKFGRASVTEVMADLAMIEAGSQPEDKAVEPLRFERSLRLEHVSFRYPGAAEDALRDIDLEVRHGESIGVVGATGSGKSTLVDLILGLHFPTAGRVTCDGIDVHENVAAWQRNAGVVPQTVFLLDDTLRRNIALGINDKEIDEEAVLVAIRLAQLEQYVASLPDGLDTTVGELGVRISGGQRQRVVIARALYHRPGVLFFDEGTSALDNATELELIRALDRLRGQRTIFTVAHRLSTVRTCDRIVLMRDGRMADVGTYDELAGRNVELQEAKA